MTVYVWNGFSGSFNDPSMWTNESTNLTPSGPPGFEDIAEFDKNGSISGSANVASVNVIGASLTFVGNITTQNFDVDDQGVADFSGGAVVNLGAGGLSISGDASGTIAAATINGGNVAVQDSNFQVGFQGHVSLTAGTGNFTVGEPAFTDLPSTFELEFGGAVTDITADVGGTSGASATVAGGIWSSTSGMNVGNSGTGTLAINLGGSVSTGAGGALALGVLRNESGTVTVSGGGSMLLSNYTTDVVGGAGSGDLAINLTATASVSGMLEVGVASLGQGTLLVSDTRSSLAVGGALIIGNAGTATGTIAADASASVTNGLTIGNQSGGSGTLTVTDTGTQLSVGGGAVIGSSGSGTLDVQAGAAFLLNSGSVVIGATNGGSGTAIVTGSTTTLGVANGLTIGALGFGLLSVQSDATVSLAAGTLDLGTGLNAAGVIVLSGTGSALTLAAAPAIIGDAGAGTLTVAAGALFSNLSGITTIGGHTGGLGTLAVAGSNAQANLGSLVVGGLGSGTLSVGASGNVTTTQDITIAAGTNSLSLLSVSGAGANLTDGGNLVVGEGGHGNLIVQSNGSVGVASGSLVIGDAKGSTGSVALGGALAASLEIGQGITIGNAGTGTLDLLANAGLSLAAGTIDIGAAVGGIGTLALAASGVTLTAPGAIVVGGSGTGTLQIIAGTSLSATAGSMIIGASSGGVGVVTVSGAAAAASLGGLIIGGAGTGTLAISAGGTVMDTTTVIGQGTGVGALMLNGIATRLVDSGNLIVGATGDGTVSVQGGATLQVNSGAVLIGAAASASAGVTLAGTGTPLQIGTSLTVGQSGSGTLSVQAGVTLDVNGGFVTVGAAVGGSGDIILAGTGPVFAAGLDMTVGSAGDGTLSIGAGAGLSVAGSLDVGAVQGGIGTITLLGSHSALTAAANVTVGDSGTGAVTVDAAGSLNISSGTLTIGAATTGVGTVTVTGTNATATLGSVVIGDAGSGSLSVGLGGTLQAQDITLGEATGGIGTLLVNGVGATARSGSLTIGLDGTGWLEVNTQGSLATTGAAVLGTEALPMVQQATILGQAIWTVGTGLTVGEAGNAIMVIGTGGTVIASSVVLGNKADATGTVTVAGTIVSGGSTAASSLFFGGELVVGNSGTADLTVNQGGVVGSPTSPSGTIEIGAQAGGIGSVSVSGTKSSLNAAVLTVGGSGAAAGGAGTLSIGAGATVNAGTVTVWNGGTIALLGGDLATNPITVDGEVTGYGTITGTIVDSGTIVANGGTLLLPGSFSGLGTLAFAGLATLVLGTPGSSITMPVTGLAGGDRIELAGLTITGAQVTSPGTVTISTTGANYLLSNVSFAPGAQHTFITGHDPITGNYYIQVQCFAAGTRIAGPHGEVAVEALRVGDSVTLAEGGATEVIWIGRRTVDTTRHPAPHKGWPVRIAAGAFGTGAFGAGVPHRDLLLSPDHAVFIEDVLIPVKRLINGSSIVQEQVDSVSYYHIELSQHDVIIAEGLPVETYLDTGGRSDFANGGGPIRLYPDFNVLAWEALGCARLVMTGPELDAARARIATIAAKRAGQDQSQSESTPPPLVGGGWGEGFSPVPHRKFVSQ